MTSFERQADIFNSSPCYEIVLPGQAVNQQYTGTVNKTVLKTGSRLIYYRHYLKYFTTYCVYIARQVENQ